MTSENAPDVTVIMVSFNTRELTLSALQTLFETTKRTALRVVVIDNASQDGSADAVAKAFPQVDLVRSSENHGFAKANNLVASQATTEFLLLLNPDTECHEGAVDNLMDFARAHPDAGIWGGRTVFPDGRLNIASCWGRITPWSAFCAAVGLRALAPGSALFNSEAYGGWARDSIRDVDIVSGCFFLVRRSLWDALGGFDLKYYMYGEEADFCLRARALGARPAITPEAEIMHLVGAASETVARKGVMVAKARATLIRDHWPKSRRPLGAGLMWLWAASRFAVTRPLIFVPSQKGRAQTWAEIWAGRKDWLAGY